MVRIRRLTATGLTLCALLLALGTLLGGTKAHADDPTDQASASTEADSDPTADDGEGDNQGDNEGDDEGEEGEEENEDPAEAGTDFRTATALREGQHATATASTGDYLYWVFPAAAGEAPRVKATVELPKPASRTGAVTWQLDVYDGLRRHQACTAGTPTKTAATETEQLTLGCRLRAVQPWADTWANDPLSGAFYVRLTALRFPDRDVGLPVRTEVETDPESASGARRGGGKLGAPLVPTVRAGTVGSADAADSGAGDAEEEGSDEATDEATDEESADAEDAIDGEHLALTEPDDGWTGSWWSDRWAWTGGGAVLAALTGIGGYHLTRRR